MKKYYLHWFACLLFIMAGASCMVSCDDDDDAGQSSNSIVGTWRYMDWDEMEIITFYANGTGIWMEQYDDSEIDKENFKYTYNEKKERLTIYFGDEIEVHENVYVEGDILHWDDDEYIRIK